MSPPYEMHRRNVGRGHDPAAEMAYGSFQLSTAKSPRLPNYDYSASNFDFLTICTNQKNVIFGAPEAKQNSKSGGLMSPPYRENPINPINRN